MRGTKNSSEHFVGATAPRSKNSVRVLFGIADRWNRAGTPFWYSTKRHQQNMERRDQMGMAWNIAASILASVQSCMGIQQFSNMLQNHAFWIIIACCVLSLC